MRSFKLLQGQRGFSSVCFFTGLLLFTLLGYVGVKVAPSYMDFRNVSNALNEVSRMDGFENMRRPTILARLRESIHRNTGFESPDLDLNEVIYMASKDGRKVVGANYEVVVPLFYNVSALLHFKYEKGALPYK